MQEEQVIQKPDENEVEVELKEEKTEDSVEKVEETKVVKFTK